MVCNKSSVSSHTTTTIWLQLPDWHLHQASAAGSHSVRIKHELVASAKTPHSKATATMTLTVDRKKNLKLTCKTLHGYSGKITHCPCKRLYAANLIRLLETWWNVFFLLITVWCVIFRYMVIKEWVFVLFESFLLFCVALLLLKINM